MSAEKKFAAIQTEEGNTLFFSIGNDGVFYLTREVIDNEAGWVKIDLSAVLAQYNNGKPVQAITFEVSQNKENNNIDIALAVTGQTEDILYLAQNILNTNDTWKEDLKWVAMGYDNPDYPVANMKIRSLYIAQSHSSEYIIADILTNPNISNEMIHRYYIDPTKKITGHIWNPHDLAANLNSTKIKSCLGRKSEQLVDGLYTMGQINTTSELIYTPLYNAFNPNTPAAPSRLKLPQGASAIAVASNGSGLTNLFVAGEKALFFFAAANQEDGDSATVALQNDLFLKVTDLYAHSTATEVIVWGLNQLGSIFYTKCALGSETTKNAWSVPVPILLNVQQLSTYVNQTDNSNVIFAHLDGLNMVQLTQDPQTTIWHQRSIVLPTTDTNDVLEFNSYSTHVQITGDDHIPQGDRTVEITATSQVRVYLNNRFTILSPDVPVKFTTDATGQLTVLQETQNIGAVPYKMKLEGDDSSAQDINPMLKLIDCISKVKTGDDLKDVTVKNEDGTTKPLVSAKISENDREATVKALQQFVTISKTLPQDGSVKVSATNPQEISTRRQFRVKPETIWGMSFEDQTVSYHEGEGAINRFAMNPSGNTNNLAFTSSAVQLDSFADAIESTAGDILNFMEDAWDTVTNIFAKLEGDIYHVFIEIGTELYRFVVNCISTVMHTVEFIFKKIGVFIEDLIQWLGFLFQWKDIVRTHNVIKNLFKRYLENSIPQIDEFKKEVSAVFTDIEKRIDEWAGLEDLQGNLSDKSKAAGPLPGKDSPQSNYGTYHLKNGMGDAQTNASLVLSAASELEQLLQTLAASIETEGAIFEKAFETIKTQIVDEASTLSAGEMVKRILAVIADVLIESVENILETSLDVIKILIQGVLDILDASLDIPVLSWLYKKITGNELTILDCVCLVVAIPATIVFKIVKDVTPFPDNSTTQAIIDAKDWSELQAIFNPEPSASPMLRLAVAQSVQTGTATKTSAELSSEAKTALVVLRIVATFSSFAFIASNTMKASAGTSKPISILNGVLFFTTTGPNLAAGLVKNSDQEWPAVTGETIYGFTSLEKLLDIFTYKKDTSPAMKTWADATKYVDCALGVAGFVPSIGSLVKKHDGSAIVGFLSTSCWNVNRILSPFADIKKTPRVFAGKMACIGLYGVGQGVLIFIDE